VQISRTGLPRTDQSLVHALSHAAEFRQAETEAKVLVEAVQRLAQMCLVHPDALVPVGPLPFGDLA